MSSSPRTTEVRQLLTEPVFAKLASESVRDYIGWDELTTRPLPQGMSAAETWELLGTVRQIGASWFPIPTLDDRAFWYALTREGSKCLQFIRRYCRSESPLHQMMQEREGHRFLVRSRIREAIATCQLDGIMVDEADAERMLLEGRAPQDDGERLVVNSYEMLRELESLSPDPFTPETVFALYERLTQGVDLSRVTRGPRRTNLAGTRNPNSMRAAAEERGILQEICDYANGVSGDPYEPVAIKGYMIISAMGYWHPLPELNETVARHMLRMFAVKRDYPVLGYLPTSRMMLDWFDGRLLPGTVRFTKLERRPVVGIDIDGTEDILTHLQLTAAAVGELLGYIEQTRSEDARLQAALNSTEDINYRQRAVLARALSRPGTEFRIRQHETSHRVVYQTARTDLLDLVDRGYLRKETRGKAFVFVPVDDLQAKIDAQEE